MITPLLLVGALVECLQNVRAYIRPSFSDPAFDVRSERDIRRIARCSELHAARGQNLLLRRQPALGFAKTRLLLLQPEFYTQTLPNLHGVRKAVAADSDVDILSLWERLQGFVWVSQGERSSLPR